MKAIVIGNCVTVTYGESLKEILPDWEVRRVDIGSALKWLSDGSKPEFTQYLGSCDLYLGNPMVSEALAQALHKSADRIIIPPIVFRGFHPDIAILPGFSGLLNAAQTSLIVLGARASHLSVDQTVRLFNEETYQALGYFDLYKTERQQMLQTFETAGIDLNDDFLRWEAQGGFFYIPIHPKSFVLIDILRRALLGRYIDERSHAGAACLAGMLPDHLENMEAWPIYPDIAARLGFSGDLIWRRVKGRAVLSLEEFVTKEFEFLDAAKQEWRQVAFVARAASMLQTLLSSRV